MRGRSLLFRSQLVLFRSIHVACESQQNTKAALEHWWWTQSTNTWCNDTLAAKFIIVQNWVWWMQTRTVVVTPIEMSIHKFTAAKQKMYLLTYAITHWWCAVVFYRKMRDDHGDGLIDHFFPYQVTEVGMVRTERPPLRRGAQPPWRALRKLLSCRSIPALRNNPAWQRIARERA